MNRNNVFYSNTIVDCVIGLENTICLTKINNNVLEKFKINSKNIKKISNGTYHTIILLEGFFF